MIGLGRFFKSDIGDAIRMIRRIMYFKSLGWGGDFLSKGFKANVRLE